MRYISLVLILLIGCSVGNTSTRKADFTDGYKLKKVCINFRIANAVLKKQLEECMKMSLESIGVKAVTATELFPPPIIIEADEAINKMLSLGYTQYIEVNWISNVYSDSYSPRAAKERVDLVFNNPLGSDDSHNNTNPTYILGASEGTYSSTFLAKLVDLNQNREIWTAKTYSSIEYFGTDYAFRLLHRYCDQILKAVDKDFLLTNKEHTKN